jgi:myo-inositol-1(or 4)-monophosphatase
VGQATIARVTTSGAADPADLLQLALDLAARASRLLTEGRETVALDTGTKSSPTDVVTAVDTAAERLIVDGLREARPGDGVLGEEGGESGGTSGVRWVIDPIDGTVNYLYRLPSYAVALAAEVDGEVEVGVVHLPATGEVYAARRGAGATRDGEPVSCSTETDLSQALVATGFGYGADRRAAQGRVVAEVLPRVRDIRRLGAAAPDLCHVASGRVDAYYERGLEAWDLAAAGLVAREAGVRVEGLHGRPAGPDLVVAAPPALFDALHDLLAPLGADRD